MRWPCQNPNCKRNMYHHSKNKQGLCEQCFAVAGLIQWLIEAGVLGVKDESKAKELGLWTPARAG